MKRFQKIGLAVVVIIAGLILSFLSYKYINQTDYFENCAGPGCYICPNPTPREFTPVYEELSYTAGFPVSDNFISMFDTANQCGIDLAAETEAKEIVVSFAFYINAVIYSFGLALIIYLIRRYAHSRD